jgi:hypothetical protein
MSLLTRTRKHQSQPASRYLSTYPSEYEAKTLTNHSVAVFDVEKLENETIKKKA